MEIHLTTTEADLQFRHLRTVHPIAKGHLVIYK